MNDTILHKDCESSHEALTLKADDLEAIQKYCTVKEVGEEDVFAGRMIVADTRVDRSHEQFDRAYLKRFAETLPGKSLLSGHDYKQAPLGRIYAAEVVKDPSAPEHYNLEARYFVDRKDEKTVRAIQLGVWKDVSIGFTHGGRVCSIDGLDITETGWLSLSAEEKAAKRKRGEEEPSICQHKPGETYDGERCVRKYVNPQKAEGREVSIVWSGCQPGARLKDEDERIACKMELLALASEKEQQMPDEDGTKAGGGDELLLVKKQLAEAQGLAADGKAYRAYLKGEIQRKYAAVGAEQTGIAICKSLEHASAEELRAAEAEISTVFDTKFPPSAQSKMVGAGAVSSPSNQQGEDLTPPRFDPLGRTRAAARRY